MMLKETGKKILTRICIVILIAVCINNTKILNIYAASGNVYTCSVTASYRNPSTGVIEDSGGENSYATGQGMVQSCTGQTGIMEVTDSGEYYLTIRMSLVDFTTNHSFWVQNFGETEWVAPSEIGVTGNGSDANGSTMDVCMKVPSENCLVRISMYVEPMGRAVIYYVYPSNYNAGNSTDMNSTMISIDNVENNNPTNNESNNENNNVTTDTVTEEISVNASNNDETKETIKEDVAKDTENNKSQVPNQSTKENDTEEEITKSTQEQVIQADNTVVSNNNNNNNKELLGEEINNTKDKGLSLSTQKNIELESNTSSGINATQTNLVVQITLAVIISGLIFIITISGIVYFFHRNWKRWGGAEDDYE